MTWKVVFFGTPEWAVPSLEALVASDLIISGVVTNPDRPSGRGYETHAPPVKTAALARALVVRQPDKARDPEFVEWLRSVEPDVCIVVAYGKILPVEILEIPRLGFVNLHFSLLPAYRGAAPVQRAVMDGIVSTGVSVMVLTEGMDEGPVLATAEEPIDPDESAGELGARLAEVGAPLLVRSVAAYLRGEITPKPQDRFRATYAPKITSDDARIDWSRPALELKDHMRGLDPAPGAWTLYRGTRVKVFRSSIVERSGEPGVILDPEALVVATGDASLVLEEVQMAGKRRMTGRELARGIRPERKARFE
jgi:methionyl-tRNA formyltransferase